jgi:AcrR family transcriptional regulator
MTLCVMERTKKDFILCEAARAFGRFGFKKASIDEIAKKAGVAKGTVYLAAESKEDLFYQVLNREVRMWIAEVGTHIDHRVPADRVLAEMLRASLKYMEERPLVRELLFGETGMSMPAWSERLEALRALAKANTLEVLRLGVGQGHFRADLPLETVADLLQDFNLGAYLFAHRRGDSLEFSIQRALVGLEIVLGGLRTRAA